MTVMRDDDRRFSNLARKVGTFVGLAFVAAVVTVVGIGIKQGLFERITEVQFETRTALDIQRGMAVKVRGFAIGKVQSIALTDEARVRVVLGIYDQHMKWVRKDSQAKLAKEGMIGATYIDVEPGTDKTPILRRGETIAFESESDLERTVDALVAEVRPILREIKATLAYVNDPKGEIRQALVHTNELMAGLVATQRKLDALVERVGPEVPGLVRSGRDTIDSARRTTDALNQTWPLNRNAAPQPPRLLGVDSYTAPVPAPGP